MTRYHSEGALHQSGSATPGLAVLGREAQGMQAGPAWRKLSRKERRELLRRRQAMGRRELEELVRKNLLAAVWEAGLDALRRQLEAEADRVSGAPKGKHAQGRRGRRHGYEVGSAVLGGVRMPILRPRVRSLDGTRELPLPTYQALQDETTLGETVLAQALAGVATRGYRHVMAQALRGPEEIPLTHVSKSSVSRRFVAETGARLEALLSRPLTERYLAVFVDGLQLGEHHVIAAVGVAEDGTKRVLGLWEGETENRTVCQALLEDLVRRGLSAEKGLLVIVDGSKALAAAVRAVWGRRAVIQRCVVHKARNVLEKLPESLRPRAERALARAWGAETAQEAQRRLEALAREWAAAGYPEAASSLREGGAETLTVLRLELPPELRRSLRSTNPIESAFSRHEKVAHRVTWWRNGRQALRWAAVSLLAAEGSFHKLPAAEALPALAAALERHVASLAGVAA